MDDNLELYRRYRPSKLSEVIGQEGALNILTPLIKKKRMPHFILLTGPSGSGKTTLARIIKKKLRCSDADFSERNVRKLPEVRAIRSKMHLAPMNGKSRVWLVDEAHQLTSESQNEFLKMLEDTPSHVYFIFATTEPQKLKHTIRTRATEIVLKKLQDKHIEFLIKQICDKEDVSIDEEVIEKITDTCDGSARKALVLLNKIKDVEPDNQLECVSSFVPQEEAAINIARALFEHRVSWSSLKTHLQSITKEEAESIRYLVLAYATKVLLGKQKKSYTKAFDIITAFSENFYDSGMAGLVAACYEIFLKT